MSRLFKSLVLVLKRRPLGEADEIVSLLSPDRGRFEAAVRGSRRSASPLVGRIEPFTELSGLFARGRSLDHLTQAEVHCARPALHRDLERLLLASYLVDLVGGASPPGEPCPELYGLLVQALDNLQAAPTPLLCRWVELRLADLLGYAPQLEACALCGASDPGWFSAESGGDRLLELSRCQDPGGHGPFPPPPAPPCATCAIVAWNRHSGYAFPSRRRERSSARSSSTCSITILRLCAHARSCAVCWDRHEDPGNRSGQAPGRPGSF